MRQLLYRMFFVLDIVYYFTCGESNLYQNLEMFRNFMSVTVDVKISMSTASFLA